MCVAWDGVSQDGDVALGVGDDRVVDLAAGGVGLNVLDPAAQHITMLA